MLFFDLFNRKKDKKINELLDNMIGTMATTENRYKELSTLYDSKVIKENILKILLKASQLIASDDIDVTVVDSVFFKVCDNLHIDEIFICNIKSTGATKTRRYLLLNEKISIFEGKLEDVPAIKYIFENNTNYIVNENEFDDVDRKYYKKENIRSVCAMPIILNSSIWGVFGFNSRSSKIWSEDDLSLCKILASMVSTYLKKKYLYNDVKEHAMYLDSVISSLPTAVVVIDAQSRTILGANSKASEITGYSNEELVNSKCHQKLCVHYKGECPVTDLGMTVNNAQCELTRKDGTHVIIMKNITSVLLHGKRHLLESFVDVTEQERSKQLLKESEHKFRTLFETLPTAMCGCTCDGTIVYWNKASEILFGYSKQEMLKSNISSIVRNVEVKKVLLSTLHTSCFDLQEVPPLYLQLFNKENKAVSVFCTSTTIKPANEQAIVYCLFVDVTSLKNTEKALEEKSHILNTTVDLIDGYMWNKDAQGRYLYCTPKWKSLFFGLPEDTDIVGKTDIELLNEYRQRTGLEHTYGNVCSGTDQHCIEQKHTCYYIEAGYIADELFLLEVTKTPLFDANDTIVGVVGIARNRSNDAPLIKIMLHEYIKKNIAINLNPEKMHDDRIVAYWIKSKIEYDSFVSQSGILPR